MVLATHLSPVPSVPAPTEDVLQSLRGDPVRRSTVDPGFAGGLREWLEDGLCALLPIPSAPLVVNKQLLRDVLAGRPPSTGESRPVTTPLALGALIDALFRQLVTVGRIEEPMRDGLDSLRIDPRRRDVVEFAEALPADDYVRLQDEVETQAAILVSRWPRLAPSWLPRTQERLAMPLAGGEVLLVGVVDLAVGAPSSGRASIALIEVKSGTARIEDREDLWFYALLETLRSGAPPSRVATFYTRTGQVDAMDVDEDQLNAAVQRVLRAVSLITGRGR
jgi:hypothetical protein